MASEIANVLPSPTEESFSQSTQVQVVLVDDNADDRALAARELRREFPSVSIIQVSDEESFENAFSAGAFDLVITDYQLGWGNGLRVLECVKRRHPDVPVIMFTGSGNEEIAVHAMKAGVQDYVLKSPKHFSKLRSSVHVALKLRQHNRALAQAEARYKNLFDTVPVGLFSCTPAGHILDANPELASILGASDRRQLRNLNFADLHPISADFSAWREALEREGSVASVECQVKGRDGVNRWVEIQAKVVRDPITKQIQYEGSAKDITERKHAEQEREKLIADLKQALAEVKTLTGLLPICASCKKIRDEGGTWNVVESYIERHSHAHFTHSFCPECARLLYPEVFLDNKRS